jgi:hypothetical protein
LPKATETKPKIRPCERRDGSGWFVLVEWGDWPSEQVGGFLAEHEANEWIRQNSAGWIKERRENRL